MDSTATAQTGELSNSLQKKPFIIRSIIVIVVACVVYAFISTEVSARLTDISGNWAYLQINALFNKGIITGYKDSTFRPDQSITRAEFATIVNRAYNFRTKGEIPYNDVMPWAWYYREVAYGAGAGYFPAHFGSKFAPNQPLTREEAAAMIAVISRLDTVTEGKLPFQDAADISDDYKNSVAAMVQAGYMKPYADGSFKPLAPISRAGAAVLIYNLQLEILYADTFDVRDYGAKGDGVNDDTEAINGAIKAAAETGGGTVYVPAGVYMINLDNYRSIDLKSNINLVLAYNAILNGLATANNNYAVVRCRDVSNVTITGGKIMGERDTHKGTRGESGHGISVQGSNNVKINDIYISNCWGDGIFIADSTAQNYCDNIVVDNFVTERNRRNGIAVVSAKNTTIRNGESFNNYGTNPQSGIDLEPYGPDAWLENILVENVYCHHNGYGEYWERNYCWGICVALGHYRNNVNPFSVTIQNCRLVNNGRGYDNEQLNYDLINTYLNGPEWNGSINYSGITK